MKACYSGKEIQFRVTLDGLWAGDQLLDNPHTGAVWEALLQEKPRMKAANAAAPGWRQVAIFDHRGIYLLCERDRLTVRSVVFVWQPTEVPYRPRVPFAGEVSINRTLLSAETICDPSEFTGAIELRKLTGATYGSGFAGFHVSVKLEKVKVDSKKRSGRHSPAYLEFSYSSGAVPGSVIAERLRKN